MMNYVIKFDKNNSNTILISKNTKIITMIACPPITKGCDIINFSEIKYSGYIFDFDGLILITTENNRKIYYRGDLVAETNRT